LASAALLAICPAYWLTSYSLLIDSALVAFLLAGLLAFIIAQERRSVIWVVASGVLMGLAMLTKYFGVFGIALIFIWQMLDAKRRMWKPGYSVYGVFLPMQLGWAAWNIATYGQSHFLAALPRGMSSPSFVTWAQKGLVLGSFVGGGTIFVLFSPIVLWRISKGWSAGLGILAGVLYILFTSRVGGFDPVQSTLLALFIGGTLSYLVVLGRTLEPARDANNAFLIAWILLGLAELVIVMPWTAGRYLLCVLPAMCWVFMMQVRKMKSPLLRRAAFAVTALAGLGLAQADYVQANSIIRLAEHLQAITPKLMEMSPKPTHGWYYLSDTFDGSQPYVRPVGWENALPHQKFKKGDLFLKAHYRLSSWWNVQAELAHFRPVAVIEMRSSNPLRVLDVPDAAGFYASCWGALPWTITNHPLERYELYQAVSE
jgi:4-amino-4-deoxy-L-arabinose transferase-like glycosyltransferase